MGSKTYASICSVISRSSSTLRDLKLCIPLRALDRQQQKRLPSRLELQSLKFGRKTAEQSCSPIHDLLRKPNSPYFPKLASLSLEISHAAPEATLTCTLPSLRPRFPSLQAVHLPGRMSVVPTQMPREEENFFTILIKSRIHLTEIQSNGVCKPMLQYLLSYKDTLKRLVVSVNRDDPQRPSATDLDKILLHHQSSLRELSISAKRNSGWSLGLNNKGILLVPLPVLDTLNIPVFLGNSNDIEDEDYLVRDRSAICSSDPF